MKQGSIVGSYRIERRIAYGGTGELFLAYPLTGSDGPVVLKWPVLGRGGRAIASRLIEHERWVASRIVHPKVVRLLDGGHAPEGPFVVLEYVDGWSLDELLRIARERSRSVPLAVACWIGRELADALEAVHTACGEDGLPLGIVHCDVTPDNVLVARDGAVKLNDFGIAFVPGRFDGRELDGGKAPYMAPERVRGDGEIDAKADIFSLGLTVHECVTGRRVFEEEDPIWALYAVLEGPVAPPSSSRPEVPRALDETLMHALARDRSERTPTAAAFRDGLDEVLGGLGEAGKEALAAWIRELTGG